MQWMPIETGPEDGQRVSVQYGNGKDYHAKWLPFTKANLEYLKKLSGSHQATWEGAKGSWRREGDSFPFQGQPSHWRPSFEADLG